MRRSTSAIRASWASTLDEPLDAIGAVDVADGEVPVFWACGVTPQLSLEGARPPLAITHRSAHMLVSDLTLDELSAQ